MKDLSEFIVTTRSNTILAHLHVDVVDVEGLSMPEHVRRSEMELAPVQGSLGRPSGKGSGGYTALIIGHRTAKMNSYELRACRTRGTNEKKRRHHN